MQISVDNTPKLRRSLSLPGHNLQTRGEADLAARLGEALQVPSIPERIPLERCV